MIRRLRVMRLKANWVGSVPMYRSVPSNHPMLALAARWRLAAAGRRSASYAGKALSRSPQFSLIARASSIASTIAMRVPEPTEKWAV